MPESCPLSTGGFQAESGELAQVRPQSCHKQLTKYENMKYYETLRDNYSPYLVSEACLTATDGESPKSPDSAQLTHPGRDHDKGIVLDDSTETFRDGVFPECWQQWTSLSQRPALPVSWP